MNIKITTVKFSCFYSSVIKIKTKNIVSIMSEKLYSIMKNMPIKASIKPVAKNNKLI